jgi:hypothetical protein
MGCTREIPCFDCDGIGQWDEEPEEGDTGISLAELVERELRFTIELQKRRAA